jgi:sugar phosphate isomerase/epimerase
MFYPSIFSNVIKGRDPEEAAAKTRELGLRSVQFVPAEVSVGFGFDAEATGYSRDFGRWAEAYRANDIEICAIAGYINLLHHDPDRRAQNIDAFTTFLHDMAGIGVTRISTETGSLATTGDWHDDPANRTPEAWDAFKAVLTDLVRVAESEGVTILIEPYVVNVCYRPELGVRMMHEIGSDNLRLCMDPTNFFSNAEAKPELVDATMRAGFAAEGRDFRLAHAKDVTPPAEGALVPGLPGPGQGMLNYPLYLELLTAAGYEGPLVIEHLTESDVPAALEFVQGHIARHEAAGSPAAAQ